MWCWWWRAPCPALACQQPGERCAERSPPSRPPHPHARPHRCPPTTTTTTPPPPLGMPVSEQNCHPFQVGTRPSGCNPWGPSVGPGRPVCSRAPHTHTLPAAPPPPRRRRVDLWPAFQFGRYLWMHNGVVGGFNCIRRRGGWSTAVGFGVVGRAVWGRGSCYAGLASVPAGRQVTHNTQHTTHTSHKHTTHT